MSSAVPGWLVLLVGTALFAVMLSLGLMLGREQIAAALQRRVVLAALLFAVVVPVPAMAVLLVKVAGIKGAVAAGILLMAISPGAPVALRRAIEAGGPSAFAPALHLAIVASAVVTVPASLATSMSARASRSAMCAEVQCSWNPISGWRWSSRRRPISESRISGCS